MLSLIRLFGKCWCQLHGAQLGPHVLIHGIPRISLKQGSKLWLDAHCTINAAPWSNPLNDGRLTVLAAGPNATIHLKKGSGVSSSRLIAFVGITVGEESLIGAGCLICDSDMHQLPLNSSAPPRSAAITIGNRVFIGAHCIILKGVTIGDDAIIGAGSVVTRDIPAGAMAAGNPATIIHHG